MRFEVASQSTRFAWLTRSLLVLGRVVEIYQDAASEVIHFGPNLTFDRGP
jgi:hypothetical protein